MTVLAIPHLVEAHRVELWAGSFDEDLPGRTLRATISEGLDGRRGRVGALGPDWETIGGEPPRISYSRISFNRLRASTDYNIRVMDGARAIASARIKTPPQSLADLAAGEEATILLGSCYHQPNDLGNRLRAAYDLIAASQFRPLLHVFCGDQVYIDAADTGHSLPLGTPGDALRDALHERYQAVYGAVWSQQGLGGVLSQAGNVFLSDDHEFWNNFPRGAPLVTGSYTGWERERWANIGRAYFRAVQSTETIRSFGFAGTNIVAVDTRVRRTHRFTEFLPRGAFERLERWIGSLTGPGLLILGQPLLLPQTEHLEGAIVDANLSTFAQYADLVRLLVEAPHDLLVLSGDVHFGRVAETELSSTRGTRLIEVISSPMALISELAAGSGTSNPSPWPLGVRGVRARSVRHHQVVSNDGVRPRPHDHFMTLGFTRSAQGTVNVIVRAWLLDGRVVNSLPPRDFEWAGTLS